MDTEFFDIQEGGLPRDIFHNRIQVAQNILNQDASVPKKISPLTVSSTVLEIIPPRFGLVIILNADLADLRYGTNQDLDSTITAPVENHGYMLLRDGNSIAVPVADGDSLFLLRDASTDVTLYFSWERAGKKQKGE